MNFSFGTPTTTAASTGGFSLGAPATSTTPTGFSFGAAPAFGATAAPATTGLSLNPTSAAPAPAATGGLPTLSFGASLGTTGATAATGSAVAPTAAAATGPTTLGATTTPANPLTASLGTPAATTATPAAATAAPLTLGGFGLSKPAEQPAGTLSNPAVTTSQPATLTLGTTNTTTAPASGTTGASLTTTTQTTQSATVASGQQLKFFQLEEFINKWTLELEEQEKLFTNQATQVNAWDNMLLANGEKIVALNEAVVKVKAEQNAMEQELEFITAQHTELEECIVPLEQELSRNVQIDLERGQTYSMAETLDSQLKQMYEDLKEVIEHLNDANKYTDPNDPLVQIGKILNAHMNSLQWIESSTTAITNRLEEINKMHETLRKDNERSFRLTYYDQ
ncbi:nuclear pore glycoprotein p62-like [Anopheles albimanus]|uniref:Nucleoporin NSP1-like C-terminal domain-containing protein n=1 Tax=Anopheles albimanus TaxID=7167 RepID=A0A182FV53_ANOAL|nr:nuclear pore glycoprotein p62-like [Anopheles albimanus]